MESREKEGEGKNRTLGGKVLGGFGRSEIQEIKKKENKSEGSGQCWCRGRRGMGREFEAARESAIKLLW